MTKDEALKLALEALERVLPHAKDSMTNPELDIDILDAHSAITAIREALAQPEHSCVACEGNPKGNNNPCSVCGLAQPEQEPVAWGFQNTAITGSNRWMMLREEIPANDQYGGALWTPLYTTPLQRKPLTDEEIGRIAGETLDAWSCARAIEAAHGIWPENSDCHGPDWTDRDGEYLK